MSMINREALIRDAEREGKLRKDKWDTESVVNLIKGAMFVQDNSKNSDNTVNILGRKYKIEYRNYDEDKTFERLHIQGYCMGPYVHLIVIGNLKSNPEWDLGDKIKNELATKQLLRHEIVHAFLAESGLDCNSNVIDGAWACNEEMVDWIAIQGPKIYKAWIDANAL